MATVYNPIELSAILNREGYLGTIPRQSTGAGEILILRGKIRGFPGQWITESYVRSPNRIEWIAQIRFSKCWASAEQLVKSEGQFIHHHWMKPKVLREVYELILPEPAQIVSARPKYLDPELQDRVNREEKLAIEQLLASLG